MWVLYCVNSLLWSWDLARCLCDTTGAMHARYQQQLSGAEPAVFPRPLQPESLRVLN